MLEILNPSKLMLLFLNKKEYLFQPLLQMRQLVVTTEKWFLQSNWQPVHSKQMLMLPSNISLNTYLTYKMRVELWLCLLSWELWMFTMLNSEKF